MYGRLLFGAVDWIYRLTGRVWYVTATNLAFYRDRWPGYDVRLTQGGDELDLLRKLRKSGVVGYEHANTVCTSARRLRRGLAYNVVVTLLVYYVSAYLLNRVFGRPVVGSAPPCRRDPALARSWPAAGGRDGPRPGPVAGRGHRPGRRHGLAFGARPAVAVRGPG